MLISRETSFLVGKKKITKINEAKRNDKAFWTSVADKLIGFIKKMPQSEYKSLKNKKRNDEQNQI